MTTRRCLTAISLAVAFVALSRPLVARPADTLDYRENVVAGGPDDFTTIRHLVLRGKNVDIGKKLAEIAIARHGTRLAKGDPLVTPLRHSFFRDQYPAHYERMQGAAAAFGVDLGGTVDVTELIFDLDLEPHCSVVYYPPSSTECGHAILSRNYDFSTETFAEMVGAKPPAGAKAMDADTYVIEMVPDRGYPSLFVCAYDLLAGCMDGINSKGLTVALLADDESASRHLTDPNPSGSAVGLGEVQICRFLLDTCASIDEAKAALLSTKQYYSFTLCHFIVGDSSGHSFVWEHSPSFNREYIVDGGGKPQIVTNHPLHRYASPQQMPHEDALPWSSYTRYRALESRIAAATTGKLTIDAMKGANRCVSASIPAPPGSKPDRTLWHALYDATDRSLSIDFYLGEGANGKEPRRSAYLSFRLGEK
ncbi:MAG: hypothetical protein HYR85_25775 [Planctomycetes bacterium]|nr:hypothetical protein [Planctomycetota bacterium]MBI3847709.1 hypothetical protein [Planctomycetota bacterium]